MEPAPTVVVVADSPAVSETLSVLLEHDCHLQFLTPDRLSPNLGDSADLALVALRQPENLLTTLRRRWPALPVVAVLRDARRTPCASGAISVPLKPMAIRSAVREGLRDDSASALRRSVRLVARTLQAELTYAFVAVRTLAPLDAARVGTASVTLFAAVMREQLCAIATAMEQLERVRARPRAVTSAPRFALALSSALAQPDAAARARGLLCHVATDTAVSLAAGPVSLAPLIAELLRWHLRRRSVSPAATVRHTGNGIAVHYCPHSSSAFPGGSWPLLLASLLLRRWSWRTWTVRSAQDETVAIGRA